MLRGFCPVSEDFVVGRALSFDGVGGGGIAGECEGGVGIVATYTNLNKRGGKLTGGAIQYSWVGSRFPVMGEMCGSVGRCDLALADRNPSLSGGLGFFDARLGHDLLQES